jgi:GTP-binding protein Era
MTESMPQAAAGAFQAGICALVGLPNVGKSTLLNGLVGERLSIVTPKAQTTRQRLLGIYTDERHQAVFVDTPGLLEPRYLLHRAMQAEADRALVGADLLVYVADAGWTDSLTHAASYRGPAGIPAILCLNKIDREADSEPSRLHEAVQAAGWQCVHRTVATSGEGIDSLRETILEGLPPSPPLYPPDEIATAPLRFFVSELIRETCFEELEQEVPYSVAIGVEEFREERNPVYISAFIYAERDSQKGIIIGRGGGMIRKIGRRARVKVEGLLDRPVYLDLRVKVMPNWRRRPAPLKLFGYDVPPSPR